MLEDLFVGADSPIKGQVDTFAQLPATAELGDLFVVKTTTGVIGINRKLKGLYRWDGAAWGLVDGIEANKVLYDNADSSLTSGTVKAAIDELDINRQDASNLTSGILPEARLPTINADWSETDSNSKAFILNKPFQTLSSSGLIPTMTSNASGGYTASASSQFSTSYYAYKAFDNSTGTRWATVSLGTYDPFWVKIELPSAKRVWKASLVPYGSYYPTSFRIEGSNDNSTWDVLGQGGFVSGAFITFEMPLITHKSYLYYRLYGRHKYGSYGALVAMQLYEAT